jgi:hypothetical protein
MLADQVRELGLGNGVKIQLLVIVLQEGMLHLQGGGGMRQIVTNVGRYRIPIPTFRVNFGKSVPTLGRIGFLFSN